MKPNAKAGPRPDPRGVLYWLSRALVCVVIAPLLGLLIGIVAAVAGVLVGELAALAVLLLFLVDIFLRLLRARRPPHPASGMIGVGDPDLDAWS